jgi:hypothetical protein
MPWGRVDDDFYDHPKVLALGRQRLPCIGLYFLAISWSNRYLTDGKLDLNRIRTLGGSCALAERLVEAGLFDHEGEGYAIHDFLSRNKSRDQVEIEREQKVEAGRKGGYARARGQASDLADGRQSAKQAASTVLSTIQARGASPRPVPYESTTPLPPKRGYRNSRRQRGETLRASGRSPRQLLEGTPEVDSRALANLAERAAAWNAAHPTDQIPAVKPIVVDRTPDEWIGSGDDA